MDLNCKSCHQDIHQGILASKFYPDQTCTTCHNTKNWKTIRFDHNQTKYPLQAKHRTADCGSCHMKDKVQQFSGLSTQCASCHADAHGNNLNKVGKPTVRVVISRMAGMPKALTMQQQILHWMESIKW